MCSPIRRALVWLCLSLAAFLVEAAELNLGVTLSLSGKYAQLGAMNEKAYRLWERDVNQRGGMLGRQVRIHIADDQSDPVRARQLYEGFITEQKVDLVLGPYSSEITEAVANVTELYRYPLLAAGASADTLWQKGRKYLFGVYITASKYSVGMLELLVRSGIGPLAIVATDDSFGKAIQAGTLDWAKALRGAGGA